MSADETIIYYANNNHNVAKNVIDNELIINHSDFKKRCKKESWIESGFNILIDGTISMWRDKWNI